METRIGAANRSEIEAATNQNLGTVISREASVHEQPTARTIAFPAVGALGRVDNDCLCCWHLYHCCWCNHRRRWHHHVGGAFLHTHGDE